MKTKPRTTPKQNKTKLDNSRRESGEFEIYTDQKANLTGPA